MAASYLIYRLLLFATSDRIQHCHKTSYSTLGKHDFDVVLLTVVKIHLTSIRHLQVPNLQFVKYANANQHETTIVF